MRITDKIKISKIIINLVVLILIYVFSFHIFPILGTYTKVDFIGIKTNSDALNSLIYDKEFSFRIYDNEISLNVSENKDELITKKKNEFLTSYMHYLKKEQDLIAKAPCPSELLANSLYNIQIYDNKDKDIDFLNSDIKYSFNVRFSFFPVFRSLDKLDINKCFEYFFKENINKYFLLYRDKTINDYKDKIESLENFNNLKDRNSLAVTPINVPNDRNIQIRINYYENLIKIIIANNFLIGPDVSYTISQQNNKNASKTLNFFMCLLIVVSINIIYKKFDKKKISKFFNKKWVN
jgi:hypothetical protein